MLSIALPQLPVHVVDAVVPVVGLVPVPVLPIDKGLALPPPPHAATNNAKQHPASIDSPRSRGFDDPEN